jgi:hypothetical protein
MMQIYYETQNDESLRSLIDTSRHFLYNDKYLSETGKENSLNFIKFTEQLLHAREKPGDNIMFKLKKNVNSTVNVQNKDWIIEKIEELKSGK